LNDTHRLQQLESKFEFANVNPRYNINTEDLESCHATNKPPGLFPGFSITWGANEKAIRGAATNDWREKKPGDLQRGNRVELFAKPSG
jgi:hypothetical protein